MVRPAQRRAARASESLSAPTRYTQVPRATLWLLHPDDATLGGDESDAQPRFEVSLRAIYIGKSVITNAQYEAFDSAHERSPLSDGDDQPVTRVSFREAVAYCHWYAALSKKP